MRRQKRIFVDFAFFDRTGIQRFLEKQAKKGWMLKSAKTNPWTFERVEPKEITFSVTYFPGVAGENGDDSEELKEFREYCEYSGWTRIESAGPMLIFYNESRNPVQIETDPIVELDTIHKAVKKPYLRMRVEYIIFGLMYLALGIFCYITMPIETLSDYYRIHHFLYGFTMLAWGIFEIAQYYIWRNRARKYAELDGRFVETKSFPFVSKFLMGGVVLSVFLPMIGNMGKFMFPILGVLGIAVILLGVAVWEMNRKSEDNNTLHLFIMILCIGGAAICSLSAFVLPFALSGQEDDTAVTYEVEGKEYYIYSDDIPLTIEDLTSVELNSYSYEIRKSSETFLLGNFEAKQEPRVDSEGLLELRYQIVTVKADFLYNWCIEKLMEETAGYECVSAEGWGAETAYQTYISQSATPYWYILCYEDRIVELKLSWEPDPEQMAVVREKLAE